MNLTIQQLSAMSTGKNIDLTKTASLASVAPAANISSATGSVMPTGPGFGEVMSSMATNTVGSIKLAEKVSMDAVTGEAGTREVVDALMTAERSLQTAIAIRDKIVTAYLDVTRMQI